MNFDEKYPDADFQDEPEPGMFKSCRLNPCWNCGEPTLWCEMNFEAALCSDECLEMKIREFIEAYNKGREDGMV